MLHSTLALMLGQRLTPRSLEERSVTHQWHGTTLGSSLFVFPWSLDIIIFVYLTMYLIYALFQCQFLKWLRAPDRSLLGPINIVRKVH